jgi:hypothetical protein
MGAGRASAQHPFPYTSSPGLIISDKATYINIFSFLSYVLYSDAVFWYNIVGVDIAIKGFGKMI